MDPDATLANIREIAAAAPTEHTGRDAELDDLIELAGLVTALDEWLSRRGYLPQAWGGYDQHAQRPYGVKHD